MKLIAYWFGVVFVLTSIPLLLFVSLFLWRKARLRSSSAAKGAASTLATPTPGPKETEEGTPHQIIPSIHGAFLHRVN